MSDGYALMRLARQRGLDYGDVLLWSDYMRHTRRTTRPYPPGRIRLLQAALFRMSAVLGDAHREVMLWMSSRADRRWGSAPL